MAHVGRKAESTPSSEAARFLEANPELRDARIDGIVRMDVLRQYVAYENQRENPRRRVLEQLEEQAGELRDA